LKSYPLVIDTVSGDHVAADDIPLELVSK